MNATRRRRVTLVVGDVRCDCAVDLVMTMQHTRMARAVHAALDMRIARGEGWHCGPDGAIYFDHDGAIEPQLFPIVLHYQMTGHLLYPWQYTSEHLAHVETGAVATMASNIALPISVVQLQRQLDHWIDDRAVESTVPLHSHPSTVMGALLCCDMAAAAQAQAAATCAMIGAGLVSDSAAVCKDMQDPRYVLGATDVPVPPPPPPASTIPQQAAVPELAPPVPPVAPAPPAPQAPPAAAAPKPTPPRQPVEPLRRAPSQTCRAADG